MTPEPVFVLFACCLPVRGARRSVLCDLARQSAQPIPNGLYEILTAHAGKSVAAIQEAYDHAYDAEIQEYFEFLLRHEFGFFTCQRQWSAHICVNDRLDV